MRLLDRGGEIHTSFICTIYRHTLANRAKRVSNVARGHRVSSVGQSRESIIPRTARGCYGGGGTAQRDGSPTSARCRGNCPGDAERVSQRCRREIDSCDVRPVDRGSLAGRAKRVTRVAGRYDVGSVC